MAEASLVRSEDVRAINRLVGECCELGADAYAWQFHLILGLRRLIGFQIGTGGMTDLPLGIMTFKAIRGAVDLGWSSPSHREYCAQFWISDGFRDDPLYAAQTKLPGPVVTHRWQDLVDSRDWYVSEPLNRYYRVADQIHLMSSGVHAPPESGLRTMFVNLLRPEGDRPFSERDRDCFHLAMKKVRLLLGVKLMPFGTSMPPGVTPRMRQVMALLLRGYAEKEVTSELGLSINTVHTHVKHLHLRFSAHSRTELLAAIQSLLFFPPPELSTLPGSRLEEVLGLIKEGYSEQQMATELGISSHTVHDYVKALYRRYNVHSRGELLFKHLMWRGDGGALTAKSHHQTRPPAAQGHGGLPAAGGPLCRAVAPGGRVPPSDNIA